MKKILNLLNPQLLINFKNDGTIDKVFFLGSENNLKTSNVYKFYLSYIEKQFLVKKYKILDKHILLTATLGEIKEYIKHLMDFKNNFILFSLIGNIEGISNERVFNPFTNKILKKNKLSELIYSIFPIVFNYPIFCTVEDKNNIDDENNDIFFNNTNQNSIYEYINDLVHTTFDFDIKIDIEASQKRELILESNIKKKISIFSQIELPKCLNLLNREKILISGSILKINPEKALAISIYFFDKDNNNPFLIHDNNLIIYDNFLFQSLIILSTLPHHQLKNKEKDRVVAKIDAIMQNIHLKGVNLSFFLLKNAKIMNIFLDRTKKVNIIMTKTHIVFDAFNIDYEMAKYITIFMICFQLKTKSLELRQRSIKVGNLYNSQFCQGKRRPVRQFFIEAPPVDVSKIKNNIFIDKNNHESFISVNEMHTCKNQIYKHIGFSKSLFKNNICLPCCYQTSRLKNPITLKCLKGEIDEEIILNPYLRISNRYKTIIDKEQIGNLMGNLFKIFNSDSKITIGANDLILNAKNYCIYTYSEKIVSIENYNKYDIIFTSDNIFVQSNLLNEDNIDYKKINFFLIIHKQTHLIKKIEAIDSKIKLMDISIEKKKEIIDKLKKKNILNFSIEDKDFLYTNNGFYYKNEKINLDINTKYFISTNIYLKISNSIGYVIEKNILEKFFNSIIVKKKELFINSFIIYISLLLGNIDINDKFIKTDINTSNLKKLLSYINPIYYR